MRRLILVRHGETDFNVSRRFQGHLDTCLNAVGEAQARAAASRLASELVVLCVSSDLRRCSATARAIAEPHHLEVELDPDLRESHLGDLQGRFIDDWGSILGDDSEWVARRTVRSRPPGEGGESALDVRRRIRRFVRHLAEREPELPAGTIVIVGHGGSLCALTAYLLGFPPAAATAFRFNNCSLTTINWTPGGRTLLMGHNEISHLAG